jgi:oligopeptide transport system substrate-binding protein
MRHAPAGFPTQRLCSVLLLLTAVLGIGCERQGELPTAAGLPDETELHRGLGAEPETLDPQLAADNASLAVAADLYEGLTTTTADGRVIPGAAESWQVSGDGREWTFHLRPDLHWSDGKALSAQAFVSSFESTLSNGSTAPNAALLEMIAVTEAPDARTLRLRLHRPCPHLPALLALPVAAPLPQKSGHPAAVPGNGPYRLVDWRPGERIVLERNPHYHSAAQVRGARVIYRPVTDLSVELNLYRTGELDLTSEVPNSQLGWIREHLGPELRVAPYLSTYSYAVNIARLPDAEARRALAMSVDRERITQKVTGAGEQPAYGWVPEGIPGYAPGRFAWHDLPYDAAVGEALALWRAARSRGEAPTKITLCTDASANHRRTAIALADLWRSALGLETEIVELEWNVYLDTRRHPGKCDLVRLGWSADFVDPEAFLAVFESGHPQNTLGYVNPGFDAALARSRAAADTDERLQLLATAEAELLAGVPVIPVFFRVSKQLVKPYVRGYQPNPLGHVASRYLVVEPH